MCLFGSSSNQTPKNAGNQTDANDVPQDDEYSGHPRVDQDPDASVKDQPHWSGYDTWQEYRDANWKPGDAHESDQSWQNKYNR